MMKILSVTSILLAAGLAWSSWGTGTCGPVGSPAVIEWSEPGIPSGFVWMKCDTDADQVYLYLGKRQVGNFRYSTGLYYPFDGERWATGTDCPSGASLPPGIRVNQCGCPTCKDSCKCKEKGKCCGDPECKCCKPVAKPLPKNEEQISVPRQDFGMSWIAGGRTKYMLGNEEICQNRAIDCIQNGVPDDRGKLRLSFLCKDQATCKKLLADWGSHPALVPFKDKFAVQSYDLSQQGPASNFAVKDFGFAVLGNPTIYVQVPSGKFLLDRKGKPMTGVDANGKTVQKVSVGGEVLHRQDDYNDGPEGLAKGLAGAVRRVDPNYQPAKDPDLRQPEPIPPPSPLPGGDGILAWLRVWSQWIVMGGVWLLVWVFTPKVEAMTLQP